MSYGCGQRQHLLHRCPAGEHPPERVGTGSREHRIGNNFGMTDNPIPIVLARDLQFSSDTRQRHANEAAAGREVRVGRGAYVQASQWNALNPRQQHILRARALSESRRHAPVLSHLTAAAIHGLPVLEPWPATIHCIVDAAPGGRSKPGVTKHAVPLDDADIVDVNGLRVTSAARTVVDLAGSLPLLGAVAAADRALRIDRFERWAPLTTREDLLEVWGRMLPFRGHSRALDVLTFADGLAGSPLESVSRVNMRILGIPRPVLQESFYDAQGLIGDTDFSWPEFGIVGEADGDAKYLDEGMRNGRSADQVKLAEKIREDRLRDLPKRVVRWRWSVGIDPEQLWARLSHAGLPRGTRWQQ